MDWETQKRLDGKGSMRLKNRKGKEKRVVSILLCPGKKALEAKGAFINRRARR